MKPFIALSLLFVLLSTTHAYDWSKYTHTVRYNDSTKVYKISNNDCDGVVAAKAIYDNSYLRIGWDYLFVEGSAELMKDAATAPIAYFGMGFVEGFLTHNEIFNAYNNTLAAVESELTAEQRSFIQQQMGFIEIQSALSPTPSMFHAQLIRVWSIVKGMYAGYKAANTDPKKQLDFTSFYLNSFQAEISDIQKLLPASVFQKHRPRSSEYCGAIVKVTGDDLFMAHNTWSDFSSMLRQYKTYKFGDLVTISMTSYPASLSSIDDWYTTSNGLAITETTNPIFNMTLLRENIIADSIPEFLRVMVASIGARNGKEWVDLFSYNNSGTYNNQFIVVDMKLFTPGQVLRDGTLWIAEQLPGSVTSQDMTSKLRTSGYWASYNIPYFSNVYEKSGVSLWEEQYGTFFSYNYNPRAEIFAQRQGAVRTVDDLKFLMRYNDYKNDRFSKIPNCKGTTTGVCIPEYSPMLAIAPRGDLAPVGNASTLGPLFEYMDRRAYGAVDAKITAWSMLQNNTLNAVIICGPTSQNQPVFQWSTSEYSKNSWPALLGMADRFNFGWVNIGLPKDYAPPSRPSKNGAVAGIVIGCIVAAGIVIAVGIIAYNRRKQVQDDERRPLPVYQVA